MSQDQDAQRNTQHYQDQSVNINIKWQVMQGIINPAVIGLVGQVNILTQTRSIPAGLFWSLEFKINI